MQASTALPALRRGSRAARLRRQRVAGGDRALACGTSLASAVRARSRRNARRLERRCPRGRRPRCGTARPAAAPLLADRAGRRTTVTHDLAVDALVDRRAEDDVRVVDPTAARTTSAASFTSSSERSSPPAIESRMPRAPVISVSMSGERSARSAASRARFVAGREADAHERVAGVLHDRAHVGEVEVDQAGHRDQVADALDALAQHVVGDPERVEHRRRLVEHLEQPVVRDRRSRCRRRRAAPRRRRRPAACGACPRSGTAS